MKPLHAMEDFKRDISYHVQRNDDLIVLSANLKDRFHDIRMEVLADFESLKITAVLVNFVRQPAGDSAVTAAPRHKCQGGGRIHRRECDARFNQGALGRELCRLRKTAGIATSQI